jgi:hypothetical protein
MDVKSHLVALFTGAGEERGGHTHPVTDTTHVDEELSFESTREELST